MNFPQFFVNRPIFAAVLSMIIFISGALSLRLLPISEYPEVVPPTVVVRATYPGANPQVVAETVASPLEQAINGVEDMLYMSSLATADGLMTLTVTFGLGTDLDRAQVLVQNRVQQTLPKLPTEVQQLGVVTEKSSPDLTMVVHLVSPDQRYDMLYLSNYATLRVRDELARLDGVGSAQVFGAGEYSMRVWLDPEKVAALNLSASEVVQAIREQNIQVAAGQIGSPPSPSSAQFQLLIDTQGRLIDEAEFERIVVKTGDTGQIVRLGDVARIELGASSYSLRSLLDNQPAAGIGIFQRPGSNALDISDSVRARMEELKEEFPAGIDYAIVYDPTTFVRSSIKAVVTTLAEALLLVVLVVVLFLQTWRASHHPAGRGAGLARRHARGHAPVRLHPQHPVAVRHSCWRSASSSTMRSWWSRTSNATSARGCKPIEATKQAMREVTGPIIATALRAVRRVRADRVHQRPDRPVLQAIRAHDRDLARSSRRSTR